MEHVMPAGLTGGGLDYSAAPSLSTVTVTCHCNGLPAHEHNHTSTRERTMATMITVHYDEPVPPPPATIDITGLPYQEARKLQALLGRCSCTNTIRTAGGKSLYLLLCDGLGSDAGWDVENIDGVEKIGTVPLLRFRKHR